jgi:4-cresol dehydrogenase (hydroxylating)
MVLPPNVSEADFIAALGEFRSAVGSQWVFSSDEDVALYRDSYSIYWGEPEERVASAAVAPAKVEEVQQVVRIANKYKIPLYPISTGRNLTYGGSAPNMRGSLVVDLKRMNQILAVDDKRNFALVEPGVSYFDLYSPIKERNLN